jgi:aspartate/methionine/tyrosine aminotransferase
LQAGREYCREKLQLTREIRELFLNELEGISNLVTAPRADRAFYFLLKVHTDKAPMNLVAQLIEEYKVAVIQGITFGIEDGCFLRIDYGALEKKTAREGITRLIKGLKNIAGK